MSQPRIIVSVGYRGCIKRKITKKSYQKNRWRASQGVTASFRHPAAPTGALDRLQVNLCPTVRLPWPAPQGNLSSDTWNHPAPPSAPWCLQSHSSHVFPLLSLTGATVPGSFPLLGSVIPVLLLWLVCPGASWHCLHQTQAQPPAASHRSHPKTLPCKPNTVSSSKQTRSQSHCQPCVKDICSLLHSTNCKNGWMGCTLFFLRNFLSNAMVQENGFLSGLQKKKWDFYRMPDKLPPLLYHTKATSAKGLAIAPSIIPNHSITWFHNWLSLSSTT